MRRDTKKWILASIFAALITVGTMIIQVPTPTKGYIHIGDSIVYLAGILLGPFFGFLAAALGSFLADVFSSYLIYAVPTFMIKGLVALFVGLIYNSLSKNTEKWSLKTLYFVIAFTVGTIIMVGGYYIYESFLYGYKGALLGVPANIIQGLGGGILAVPVLLALDKNGFNNKNIMNK